MSAGSRPAASVVMPVYGAEKYVEAAVRSVLEQTFTDFEFIIVDDGCLDHSIELCRTFDDPRITIVSQENRGLPGARNTGIRASTADIVGLIDADDIWLPTKLEAHVELLRAEPRVGVSYSASRFIDEAGEPMGPFQRPKLRDVSVRDVFCRNPIGNGSAAVVRRQTLEDIAFESDRNGVPERHFFDESFRAAEDVEFWTRIACTTSWGFRGIEDALTDYRVVPASISSSTDKHYEHWQRHLAKVQEHSPAVAEEFGELARAYQMRFYARRDIQAGHTRPAARWFARSMRAAPRMLVEEPARTLVTGAAIAASAVLPTSIMDRLIERASR